MFTITADNVIELLKEVTDNTLREKIIQLAVDNISSVTGFADSQGWPLEHHLRYHHLFHFSLKCLIFHSE
ncbi:hypothetical protein H5410_051216 [Solanum commersonii]|uniref:Uncharacterized protein n=1 Tax=Solanum commersonii TaxID=4109 RepID=A0A9J5WZC8_SOLCO|nr:hypothetical protein H5410_051216 [Solanum commersonii]